MQFFHVYKCLNDYKVSLFKVIIYFLLFCNASKIYFNCYSLVEKLYGLENVEYIFRLTIIVATAIVLVLCTINLRIFLKRNAESLLLLGLNNTDILKLYFVKYFDGLVIYFFIRFMIAFLYKQSLIQAIIWSVLSISIIVMVSIFVCLVISNKYVRLGLYILFIGLTIFLAMGKVSYETVYDIIMSYTIDCIFVDISLLNICCRLLIIMISYRVIDFTIKYRGFYVELEKKRNIKLDFIGDILHKWGDTLFVRVNYVWMYRNYDFIIWKVFSSIVYVFLCLKAESNGICILSGYVIALVSASYLYNVYGLERLHLPFYCISDFDYKDLLKMHAKSSCFIVGDNVILISLLISLQDAMFPFSTICICILVLLVVAFINVLLYERYPQKIYMFDYIVMLIKLHIPVYNVFVLQKSYRSGIEKWSKL